MGFRLTQALRLLTFRGNSYLSLLPYGIICIKTDSCCLKLFGANGSLIAVIKHLWFTTASSFLNWVYVAIYANMNQTKWRWHGNEVTIYYYLTLHFQIVLRNSQGRLDLLLFLIIWLMHYINPEKQKFSNVPKSFFYIESQVVIPQKSQNHPECNVTLYTYLTNQLDILEFWHTGKYVPLNTYTVFFSPITLR